MHGIFQEYPINVIVRFLEMVCLNENIYSF